jgi:hypothetical protein
MVPKIAALNEPATGLLPSVAHDHIRAAMPRTSAPSASAQIAVTSSVAWPIHLLSMSSGIPLGDRVHPEAVPQPLGRTVQLGPVVVAAAFDLGEFGGELAPAGHERGDSGTLRIEAEAGLPLAIRRNPIVSNKVNYVNNSDLIDCSTPPL